MRFLLWYFALWVICVVAWLITCFVARQWIEVPPPILRGIGILGVPWAAFYAYIYDDGLPHGRF